MSCKSLIILIPPGCYVTRSRSSPPEPEEDTDQTARRGRKRTSAELEAPEPTNKMARMCDAPKPASLGDAGQQITDG
jgi:hypothetical protein